MVTVIMFKTQHNILFILKTRLLSINQIYKYFKSWKCSFKLLPRDIRLNKWASLSRRRDNR